MSWCSKGFRGAFNWVPYDAERRHSLGQLWTYRNLFNNFTVLNKKRTELSSLGIIGGKLKASLTPLEHHDTMIPRGLRGLFITWPAVLKLLHCDWRLLLFTATLINFWVFLFFCVFFFIFGLEPAECFKLFPACSICFPYIFFL